MKDQDPDTLDQHILSHPLIRQLGEMSVEMNGFRLMIVYPNASGWSQKTVSPAAEGGASFCRLIQKTEEGAKHCRMCHILMAVAACSGGPVEQRCHAGAAVLVMPAVDKKAESVAVLSSCLFAGGEAWAEARARGAKLGADLNELRKAFNRLPKMRPEDRRLTLWIMRAMGSAVQEVKRNMELQAQVRTLQQGGRTSMAIEELLRNNRWAKATGDGDKTPSGTPLLIHVVCELIRQRPDLPLSVKELAAAARLTPNHFTSLFHRHTGRIFTEYLADERIQRAKQHLRDLTLNIGEIARRVGYDDPGYFARWFRLRTGLSPREWRERGGDAEAPGSDGARPPRPRPLSDKS